MEKSYNSDRMAKFRDICCSLLMLLSGLFFCLSLATLIYFTCETIAGRLQFCTLWIDVPGRVLILLICYYVASICRFLPLPQRCHLHSFVVPFSIWRLRSWRRLFRNMCFSFPSHSLLIRLQRNVSSVQENLETPLLREKNQERLYTCSPRRRCTTPIVIPCPERYSPPVFFSNPEITPRNEAPEIIKSSNGSINYIDPSFGDIVIPIMPRKSAKRHYISGDTIKESESPCDRDGVPSKYRKRFTEIKWPGEAAGNVSASPPDNLVTARERLEIRTSDNKSKALVDDDRLTISRRQEKRGLGCEIPEVHIKKNTEPALEAKTLATDVLVARDDKYFEVTEEKRLVSIRQQELRISGSERHKVDTTDDRLEIRTRNKLLSETNDQPGVHKRNRYHREAACIDEKEASSEYHNIEEQSNFPGTHNGNHQPRGVATDLPIAREQALYDKYFEETGDENLETIRQKGSQTPGDRRPEVHTRDDGLQVLTRTELLSEACGQSTVQKSNVYPGEASCSKQRKTPSEYRSTEAQLEILGAPSRNQQPREATTGKDQEIPLKFRSAEAQINFPGTFGRNQQPDRESITREQQRARNNKTSFEFPLFPWIIFRNLKRESTRAKEVRKKHLELLKQKLEGFPETRNRRQVHLNRSLARCQFCNLRSQNVVQTRLTRSHENINLLARSSRRSVNLSSSSAKSSDRRIEMQPAAREYDVCLTTNRYDVTQKQGRLMNFSHAMNLRRSLVDRATRRRRQLPSLRSQVYPRTRLQMRDKTEVKINVEHENSRENKQKDSKEKMTNEEIPSNFSKFQDDKRTGIVKPVIQETADENFNKLQHNDLRIKLEQSMTHHNNESSVATDFKQNICTETINKNKDIAKSTVSSKSSEEESAKKPYVQILIDSPLITSESDDDSNSEHSK